MPRVTRRASLISRFQSGDLGSERPPRRGLTLGEWRCLLLGAVIAMAVLSLAGRLLWGPEHPEPYCDGTTRVWQVEGDLELQAWAPECLPSTTTAPR